MKYTREKLEPIVKQAKSISDVIRLLNLKITGGTHRHIKNVIKKLEIDTSHFLGRQWNKGTPGKNRQQWWQVLVFKDRATQRESAVRLRRSLIEFGREYKCEFCGLKEEWNNKKIRLHVDHKNGNFADNRQENLRFLCPNCHSQTENFGHNKGKTDLLFVKSNPKEEPFKKKGPSKEFLEKLLLDGKSKTWIAKYYDVNFNAVTYWIKSHNITIKSKYHENHTSVNRAINKPTKEDLQELIWKIPATEIAKIYKISDKAIGKWCKKYELNKPPRGYWSKK